MRINALTARAFDLSFVTRERSSDSMQVLCSGTPVAYSLSAFVQQRAVQRASGSLGRERRIEFNMGIQRDGFFELKDGRQLSAEKESLTVLQGSGWQRWQHVIIREGR